MAALAVLASLLATGALYQALGAVQQRRRYAPPGQLIDVGGHRLHVVCQGKGRPVVILESGIAASSISWAMVQPQIARFTRVCAYDRAGLGWSDRPSGPRSFDRIVNELCRVVAHVAPRERYVLVGHSFGCFVTLACAARRPADVAGLVLVDPPTEWLTKNLARARMLGGARHLSRFGALLARVGVVRVSLALLTGGAPGAARRVAQAFGPTAARTLERLVGEIRKLPAEVHPVVQSLWCQPKCFSAMADHLRVLEREGSAIASLSPPPEVPLTVVSSGDQPAEQVARHRELAEHSSHGRHVIATRSAHWVHLDEPDLIVGLTRELVERALLP